MTEQEWLSSSDPQPMLEFLRQGKRPEAAVVCPAYVRSIWQVLEDERATQFGWR
jgi:hypothetical protein